MHYAVDERWTGKRREKMVTGQARSRGILRVRRYDGIEVNSKVHWSARPRGRQRGVAPAPVRERVNRREETASDPPRTVGLGVSDSKRDRRDPGPRSLPTNSVRNRVK